MLDFIFDESLDELVAKLIQGGKDTDFGDSKGLSAVTSLSITDSGNLVTIACIAFDEAFAKKLAG
jgi:hypothetical protein